MNEKFAIDTAISLLYKLRIFCLCILTIGGLTVIVILRANGFWIFILLLVLFLVIILEEVLFEICLGLFHGVKNTKESSELNKESLNRLEQKMDKLMIDLNREKDQST